MTVHYSQTKPNHTKQNHTKPYQTKQNHTSLYLQLSITAISIHNATLLSCHFRKIATVSHFRLVSLKVYLIVGVRILDLVTRLPEKIDCQKVFCKCLRGGKSAIVTTIKLATMLRKIKTSFKTGKILENQNFLF